MSSFSTLVELGEQLAATKKKLQHRALIAAYLKSLPPDEIAIAARLLIGRVFPENDARILNLSGAAIDRAVRELVGTEVTWDESAVDFGDAVEKMLTRHKHEPHGEPLWLMNVYRAYERIAEVSGEGARERKERELRELMERASAREVKYIVKQVIGEMRVGVSEGTLLDAIADASGIAAAAIRRANQTSGDVGAVARVALTEGVRGLSRLSVRVGIPLKPMLAQSAELGEALGDLTSRPTVALEYKFDGARVQIHKRGDEVRLFSRNLSDLTASLPEIAEQARREIRAQEAILDGEVVAMTADGRPRPFQEVMRRIGRERDVEATRRDVPVKLYLFDVLVRDGRVLLDEANEKRWRELREIKGTLETVERIVPRDVAEGEAFMKRAREAGHEGLMAKRLDSPYAPGERGTLRHAQGWLKIKPVITLDLVIVAADWGYGRRTGWLSNLHLAARDETTGKLMEVGKTFKGLTDAEFKDLTRKLLADKTAEKRGTVFVNPKVVVEVAFNNVQKSPRYAAGVALRLARVVGFRPDKSVSEIETVQRLRGMV